MEYGDAISANAISLAVGVARRLLHDDPRPLRAVASDAVSQTFCVCVVDGEDAAEGRVSDVHKRLIEAVLQRLETGSDIDENAAAEVQ
jgi:hypothetical protein